MLNAERLMQHGKAYGMEISRGLVGQLEQYASLLVEWNGKINLTAITQPEEMEIKHFLDCLLLAKQPEIGGKLLDVGSGAGFPGVVVKLAKPEVELALMEPTGKRVVFLQELCAQMGIKAAIYKERAEEAARKGQREQYDVVTARAVAGLPMLCEYCLPLVRVGGWFAAMKGEAAAELEQAAPAIEKLGGRLARVQEYALPDGSSRSLIFIEKHSATPRQYPRAGGVIKKRPL